MKDLKAELAVVHLLDAQDLAHTDTKTSLLDLAGFDGALISVNVGALTGVDADNHLTPVLQESDTTADSAFAAVDAANISGAFTKMDASTEDQVTQVVGYKGTKRYIRVLLDYGGTGISASLVSVDGILGYPKRFPATGPAPVAAT